HDADANGGHARRLDVLSPERGTNRPEPARGTTQKVCVPEFCGGEKPARRENIVPVDTKGARALRGRIPPGPPDEEGPPKDEPPAKPEEPRPSGGPPGRPEPKSAVEIVCVKPEQAPRRE